MRFAEEVVAAHFVPTWRGLLARRLHEMGLPQVEIAAALSVTQSAVSKHLQGRLVVEERIARDPRVVAAVERVAQGIATKALSPFQALLEAEALVRQLEDRGPICAIHEEEMPALAGLGCDVCIRVGATALLPEQAALQDLRAAVRILEATPGLAAWMPHVGTNVARAVPGATDVSAVAAIPGGLFEMRGVVKVAAPPEMGVSRHVAEVLLAILRRDPARLACLNLAPAPGLLAAARAAGLAVEEVAPEVERILRASAPEGAELEVELWSSSPPGLVSPESPVIQLGLDAFERALGVRPALIRSGGTLPIVPALADKGIPTVITGFGLPDSQIHSPNERLVAEYVPLGIRAARELYLGFAAL